MIEYLDIINKIKNVKLDAISYFNEKVSIPLALSELDSVVKTDNKSIYIERQNQKIELTENDRNAYFEIIYILKNIDTEMYNKINFKYIDFFQKFKLNNVEKNEEMLFDNLDESTLKILSILNLKFWCETDDIRKEFLENMNPKKELKMSFEKKHEYPKELEIGENEGKELTKTTWWTRLLNKMRSLKDKK